MVVEEEDPEKIRRAGNELFHQENIEVAEVFSVLFSYLINIKGALEKYEEAIACGARGSQMSAENLSKTYRWHNWHILMTVREK